MTLKNTDNSYIITVENKQTIDGVSDTIAQTSNGSYTVRGNKHYILYKDENAVTAVIYDGKVLNIKRNGDIKSNMRFSAGERNSSLYIMPYGKTVIYTDTSELKAELDDLGGYIKIKYTLDFNDDKYYNDMCIRVVRENYYE